MSEQKISGHTEELPGGGLRFIFDESVNVGSDDTIAIEWGIGNGNVTEVAFTLMGDHRISPEWEICYDNDTGSSDDGFAEWWTVSDGERNFTCKSEDDANWLCNLLNQYG